MGHWSATTLGTCALLPLDFVAGFMIYVIGLCLLMLIAVILGRWVTIYPPVFSFEMVFVFQMFMVIYARVTIENPDALLAAHNALSPKAIVLLHSSTPILLFVSALLIQVVPFVTIGDEQLSTVSDASFHTWTFRCNRHSICGPGDLSFDFNYGDIAIRDNNTGEIHLFCRNDIP
jgi:hypothetical protein